MDRAASKADLIRVACQVWYDEISDYEYPGEDSPYLNCSYTKTSRVKRFSQVRTPISISTAL